MSIGREYQNNLYESLRLAKNKRTDQENVPETTTTSDELLLEHLEYQANVRKLLDTEMKKPSIKKLLDQYSLQITAGSYFDQVSNIVNAYAAGDAAITHDDNLPVDSIELTDVENVHGSIFKLSTIDLEANQLGVEEIFRIISADPSVNHFKQIELVNRLSNPDNTSTPNSIFSSGIFAYDRIAAAKRNVFIGMGRAVNLLDALEADCLLEINFELGLRAETLPSHDLSNPPIPLYHRHLSLSQAALKIIDNGTDS